MPQRGAPQFGASLPHDRRRERPVGPGQFHSERRIRAGQVVPPGRCGFAMVRRSGGATARPLESIWASLPHDRRRERPVGPGQFHSERRIRAGRVVPPGICHGAPQRGRNCPATAFRAVRICHGAPQRGRNCPATGFDLEPLCRMIAAGRGPSDRASFIQRGESERAVWCLPGGADLPWCAAAGAQLPGHWIRFGPLCRMIGAGRGPSDRASFIQRGESERAVWCLPGGADLPWCAAAGAQLPGHWSRFGPLCRMIGAGRGPSDRASFIQRPLCESERAVWPPGRCGFAMVRRSGGATARPLDSIWSLSAAWSPPGEARRTGPVSFREANQSGPCGASRAVRICHGAPQRGRNCPATGFDLGLSAAWSPPGEARRTGPVSFREANQSGPCGASRAVRICHGAPQRGRNCPATGVDLGLSAAWSPPGEARRTGPVSFREANQSGPCGASRAVRICHGAPQRGRNCPATGSIWSLSAAWSPPGEARRTGPVSFREANQSGPCGASRAVRICHGAPQRGRNCPATGFDLGLSAA